MSAHNNYETGSTGMYDNFTEWHGELKYFLNSEIFWRRAFDLMRMAVESSLYPVISRQDAIQIIGRRSVDNAVKNGKLPPVQHGKQLFFDRISFYEYCKLGSLDIYGAGYP